MGAAHWVAQWARWKTRHVRAVPRRSGRVWRTFFNAVLAGLAIVVNLACHALDALIVVVLWGVALLRLGAFCGRHVSRVPLRSMVACVVRSRGGLPPQFNHCSPIFIKGPVSGSR